MKMKIKIPFQGFYGTIHEGELDYTLDAIIDNLVEDHPNEDSYHIADRVQAAVNWKSVKEQYIEEYAALFFHKIEEETNLAITPTEIELDSPREYNFRNDAILAQITTQEWMQLYKLVDRHNLKCEVAIQLAPRSGFIPFYSNDLEDWGEPEMWEAPQIELALQVLMEQFDEDFEEVISDEIDTRHLFDSNIDWDEVDKSIGVKE